MKSGCDWITGLLLPDGFQAITAQTATDGFCAAG